MILGNSGLQSSRTMPWKTHRPRVGMLSLPSDWGHLLPRLHSQLPGWQCRVAAVISESPSAACMNPCPGLGGSCCLTPFHHPPLTRGRGMAGCGGCAQDRGEDTQHAFSATHVRPRLCPASCHCPAERTFPNMRAPPGTFPPLPTPPQQAQGGWLAGWELAHRPPLPLCTPPGMIIKRKLQKT